MKRAVIVGAGIAGLATALRLGQDGWQTVVVERAPARRSSGYLVNLLGPGYDAAERLGLLTALSAHDLGLFTTVLVRADGRPKFTVPSAIAEAALGKRVMSVFRGDLESTLYDAVRDRTEIRFGTTVTSMDQDTGRVRVALSDGTTEDADLLVGADGVHSATRTAVFGSSFRVDLPYVVGAFPLPHPVADVPGSSGTTFIGPGRTAAIVNLGPQRSSAFFTYRCEDPAAELGRGPVDALGVAFGDLGGGVPDAIRHLEKDPAGAYFDTVSQVVMPRWSTGRVALLGDAAWCVTLFAGHGAALALAGADQLGAALQRHDDVPTALTEWETGLRPEATKRQALARRGMLQYAPPSRFHVWMSDLTVRAITLPGVRGLVRRGIDRANR
ncbi:FAD-dependent oxidoreductase [Micromonospora peucetia]|uniref:2-polyprenyl-6-methoxyphenol hydroxylase n=1 Tax=Micromonospora peucetia TaxID=47871 RepID=A0A1C6U0B9_9ACTN|nr:FAD-dependent oxidoreductase [Micromonospora peucetia]MCX4385817.1 FAD-dependent oxidoreductase [Micromonospora peucetia]WSA33200.1 FAD-dependent oxidoreductase [Micromonospora peucetia]SCL47339.1 2-polyprenyl-6-methoxyphenol hydroxylase [Micromonospora peucetia]